MIDRLDDALSGRYAIERELGSGGMATVYLADDLRHDRKVAIKVLRPELAAVVGAERFLAEIKTTAKLQHPYILPLHDSGEADGFLFYVMPYVRGESLRDRLDREKQLATADAIDLARKVADALDYAHEKGVVHRDIKPANILLSERGEPLVADFGIALAVSQAGRGRITETGLSLGTPHYMSPEQATGEREIDRRSDVYALGCVLYEMLAGQPPFAAPTAQAVLVRILTEDASDVRDLRRSVPDHVASALARALEKLPADRFADAGGFKDALDDPNYSYRPTATTRPTPTRATAADLAPPATSGRTRLGLLAAAAGVLGLAMGVVGSSMLQSASPVPGSTGTVVRMPLDSAVEFGSLTNAYDFDVSPDGSTIVFTAGSGGGSPLEVIELDGPTRRTLPGTDGAENPRFSADGRQIVFTGSDLSLQRVGLDGGAPTSILQTGYALVSAWDDAGTLYFIGLDGAYRLTEGGRRDTLLTRGLLQLRHLRPLPGADAVLFTEMPWSERVGRVRALDIESGEVHDVVEDGFDARYAPTGHLLYGRSDRSLVAVPFDLDRLETTGTPQVVLDSIVVDRQGDVAFRLTANGSAVYLRGAGGTDAESTRIAFVSLSGEVEVPRVRPGDLGDPTVSPDGRKLAYVRDGRIHVFDLVTGRDAPLIEGDPPPAFGPIWSPDGSSIAFANFGDDTRFVTAAVVELESGGAPRAFENTGSFTVPWAWTPDGTRLLIFQGNVEENLENTDLMTLDPSTGEIHPYLESEYAEGPGALDPGGRWAAYLSDESGSREVYVRSFPVPGLPTRVSAEGEGDARPVRFRPVMWTRDGSTIYYVRGDSLYAVPVDPSGDAFTAGEPEAVLSLETELGRLSPSPWTHPLDDRLVGTLAPRTAEDDGEDEPEATPRAYIVVNWLREMLDRIEGR